MKWLRWLSCAVIGLALAVLFTCNYPFKALRQETECSDTLDNDGDGLTDCNDDDCASYHGCIDEDCSNQTDDDDDGDTDCADSECSNDPACGPETDCSDGVDNDGDNLTDCDDDNCTGDAFCQQPRPCNNNSTCEGFEDCFWCADCCPQCSLTEGDRYDYIIDEVILPVNATEALSIGIDLDGDGHIDNKLGQIFGMFPEEDMVSVNSDLADSIQNGTYILLGQMRVSSWPDDDTMAVQLFPGNTNPTIDATEDNLTGNGFALIASSADRTLYLCGELDNNMLETGPRTMEVPIYLMGDIMLFRLEPARMVSTAPVTDTEWQEMMVGGGLTWDTIENTLIPNFVVFLNARTTEDPTSSLGDFVLNFVDANCRDDLPGCENVINGQGDCAPWDNQPTTPVVTATELRCNIVFVNALQPDVDLDGDGVNDVLSVGFQMSAIHITINN